MIFGRREPVEDGDAAGWLVAGLGNPGKEFERNRHNVGFRVVDGLGERFGIALDQRKFNGRFGAGRRQDQPVFLLKPQTYVNDSGKSVGAACRFYRIGVERLVVVCDDIDLPFARIRIRTEGSSGGHNGLKSIISALGNRQDFARVRIGVGRPPHVREVVVGHVLENFSKAQEEELGPVIDDVCDAIELVLQGEILQAMDRYNGVRR
ncbi:MAG: aminoacyl-tRNA hydrolase [Chloroflexi bacterium]|nr:aminoacyl-tRNA hydrolase [Chloroflexota bacterium]